MPFSPLLILFRVLIAAKGDLARPHLNTRSIHRLDIPAARERNNPLRTRIFMPIPGPADRQFRKNQFRFSSQKMVVPLSRRLAHRFFFKAAQSTLSLPTDTVLIRPDMPVNKFRFFFAFHSPTF